MSEEKPGIGRWGIRLAAVAALASSLVVVGFVVAGSIDGDQNGTGGAAGSGEREQEDDDGDGELAGCEPEAEGALDAGYYVVQEGDILSAIALRTCVPEPELTRLNSDVDPQTLAPGQCLSLVERGCRQRQQ